MNEPMQPLLYSELVDWYRLLDPAANHRVETERYLKLLAGVTFLLTCWA